MKVIGLCRFSYPAIGGFQVEHDSLEARMAYLYSAARMEERFRLFENITLPSLRAQSDADFTFVILIGDTLPAPYEARLRDLVAGLNGAEVVSRPSGQHRPIMKEVLNSARHDRSAPCLQFRLDDDDAVAIDFIANLREAARDCAPLLKKHKSVAFDFNHGFLVEPHNSGLWSAEVVRPLFTAALAMYVRGDNPQSIMNFSHNKLSRFMPTVTLTQRAMFVRSHNQTNDSRQGRNRPEKLEPVTQEHRQILESCFAIGSREINQLCALD